MAVGAALYFWGGFRFDGGGGLSFDNRDGPMGLLIVGVGISVFTIGLISLRRIRKNQRSS